MKHESKPLRYLEGLQGFESERRNQTQGAMS